MPYYFNLPKRIELTKDQRAAVDETSTLALSGGPGTGKSVVCLWRHIVNYQTGLRKSLLLTYTKSLEYYLRLTASGENDASSNNIDRILRWTSNGGRKNYDEIIVDEAQDVTYDKFEIIKRHTDNISYGADKAQSVYLTNEQLNELTNWFGENLGSNEPYSLERNFRNSQEILNFTKKTFPNYYIPQHTVNSAIVTGINPVVRNVGYDIDSQADVIMSIIDDFADVTHNIGILLPSKKYVQDFYSEIIDRLPDNLECSKYEGDMDKFENLANIHVTTFKSSKGLEFHTVIIPKFNSKDWFIDNVENFTDNDYYVAFTRAKINLYLIN
jgi:superfamily I DNA/RNA helicase